MKASNDYDYGECDVCGTLMVERQIKQDFRIRGQLIVVENVPAGLCPQCGDKVVNAEVGHQIIALLENSERIAEAPRITVPLLEFV